MAPTPTYGCATDRTRLDIEVEDDGHGLRPNGDAGHGLLGIRERVALYDGTVDVTGSATGGVLLAASLPLREAT